MNNATDASNKQANTTSDIECDASDTSSAGTNDAANITVSLWAAKIPYLGFLADHHWFVINRHGNESRWEVWQKPDACSSSWGHLNLNLLPPAAGVGNGEALFLHRWTGDTASELATRIEQSPQDYPWCNKYRYWPGPNSNTYVQWVLLGKHLLGHRALGKQYCRIFA
jgi:hypothetical protein